MAKRWNIKKLNNTSLVGKKLEIRTLKLSGFRNCRRAIIDVSKFRGWFGCAACRKLIDEYSPVDLLTSCDGLYVVVNVFFSQLPRLSYIIFSCVGDTRKPYQLSSLWAEDRSMTQSTLLYAILSPTYYVNH